MKKPPSYLDRKVSKPAMIPKPAITWRYITGTKSPTLELHIPPIVHIMWVTCNAKPTL